MESIINKINNSANSLKEEELDSWIVPEIFKHYQTRIDLLSNRAYGTSNSSAVLAFREMAKGELRTALNTFLFKAKHWTGGRDINPYLMTSLNRLADRAYYNNESVKKTNLPTCPLCKEENRKEFLLQDGGLWKCENCSKKSERLLAEIETKTFGHDKVIMAKLNAKYNLYKIFALHSRKGYKCLECSRFIPESINTENGITCPYDDCIYLGKIEELESMTHPVSLTQRKMVSLQNTVGNDSDLTMQDCFKADILDADVCIDVHERNKKEYDTLVQVIDDQIGSIKRMNFQGTLIQKLLMYEAYKIMLDKYPEDMVSYLVHQKQNADFPIQSKIFQEYAELIENVLPLSIKKNGEIIDIVDLTDPNLSLFLGISKFEALVRTNNTIPNNTIEKYVGGRKFKDYGPCFIGKLIDVIDITTSSSIKNAVKEYGFSNIKIDESVLPGTPVLVTHFRIASHFELNSMVFLQNIRRNIVDSVYFRLNKKKRIPRSQQNKEEKI